MQIETHRLRLLALSPEQITLLVQDRSCLEKSLRINLSHLQLNAPDSFMEELYTALEHFILPSIAGDPLHYEWYTHWLIIHQGQNVIIGGIGAAGPPDTSGIVRIGYFIDSKFEGQGMATEAVWGFVKWMSKNSSLKYVEADTLQEGIGSQKVLQKCGFVKVGSTDELVQWQYRV